MLRALLSRRLLPLVLLVVCGASQAEFKDPLDTPALQTDRLTSAPMTAVVNAGGGHLVAAGWRGVIAVSDDAGRTWKQASVPVREDLTALAFPAPKHGWAVGNEGVLLESTDGGYTWVKRLDGNSAARLMVGKYQKLIEQNPSVSKIEAALKEANNYLDQAPARPFLDIAFENEQIGYIVGTFGMVFRTVDGGRNWEPLIEKTDNPLGYNIYAVKIFGGDVYLVGELGLALRLDRTKDQFVKMPLPYEGTLFALAANSSSAIAAGLRGNAFVSRDAGKTWQPIAFGGPQPATFSAAATLDNNTVALVSSSGQLLVSRDGGKEFKLVEVKSPMRYAGIADAGRDSVVLVGLQGIRMETIQ